MADRRPVDAAISAYVAACDAEHKELAAEFAAYRAEYPDAPSPEPTPPPKPSPAPTGWVLQYETDFDTLDDWGVEDGTGTLKGDPLTVYNNQTQSNDNSINLAKNVTCSPSKGLTLTSRREPGYSRPFTSAEVVGKSARQVVPNYFRAEVVGTFRDEQGVWPCLLWFRPHSGGDGSNGEIDVMEWMGGMWTGTQKRVAVTMHNEYGATQDSIKRPLIVGSNPWYDPNVQHTYLIEKTPGLIVVTVDGRWTTRFAAADKAWWNRIMEAGNRTWYARITSQIGDGSKAGGKKIVPDPAASWTGTEMSVRSLRLWKRAP